ncbi:hypothetical protein MSIMFB_02243 [Mycobacterium simulans]|uniref:ESX-1 secretion-associated protein n=1 Tax=Mycobacterium simulans TaxID=627089 RepID=A0A7Z7N9F7_9MYCO|nr:hypothetical protein [Mycobacterium simulans]SOJ54750.1 hypothetical protein MSIMFB_02243 [Mycobacterium simulans]
MQSDHGTAELRVSGDGLRIQAGWCESVASTLAGNRAPIGVGSTWLESAAAVNLSSTEISAAAIRCTVRVQATATKLAAAATSYAATEAGSAAQFRGLNGPKAC